MKQVFIPNQEIAQEFKDAIEGDKGWQIVSKALIASEELLEATINQEAEIAAVRHWS